LPVKGGLEQRIVQNAAGHIPGIKETSKYDIIACYLNTAFFPSACKEWDPTETIPCDHTAMVEEANCKALCVHILGERQKTLSSLTNRSLL